MEPRHRRPFPCSLVRRWRRGADKGALAALAVPCPLARRRAGGGTDNGASAFWAVPLLAHTAAAVVGEVCLSIVGHPLLAGETTSWRGSVPWHHQPSLACWRDDKLMAGRMPFVYLVEITGIEPVTRRWRRGADNGALAALAVPRSLARRRAGGGMDDGALAFSAVPSLAHGTAAVAGEACLGIVGHPLLAGETTSWRGSAPWHCRPSLARWRDDKLAAGHMTVPWHPWMLLVRVLVATAGWTESSAVPCLLA
jgi:hypothetical protein